MDEKWRDILILIIAVADISTASILVRLSGVHGFVAAWWRLGLSSLITLALLSLIRGLSEILDYSIKDIIASLVSGALLALHFGLWMLSLEYINIAPSVTIVDSYPALLTVLGIFLFGENYRREQIFGAIIAMLGVAGLAYYSGEANLSPEGGNPYYGALLSFGGMIAVAGYFLAGKYVRGKHSTLSYTLISYTTGWLVESLMVAWIGVRVLGYSKTSYIYLILLAILPMMGGHTLINFVLGRFSLLASTVPVLGEPVGASILGWIILRESLTLIEIIFMAVILVGISLTVAYEKVEDKNTPNGILDSGE